jgi:hypothetical protein
MNAFLLEQDNFASMAKLSLYSQRVSMVKGLALSPHAVVHIFVFWGYLYGTVITLLSLPKLTYNLCRKMAIEIHVIKPNAQKLNTSFYATL